MERWLRQGVNWSVTGLTVLVFILFLVLVLPKVSAYTAVTIGGSGSPDTDLMYSAEDLYQIAESYGPEGRRLYVVIRWTFDLVWPLVYGGFLVALSISLTSKRRHLLVRKVYLLPLMAMFFDYMENTLVTLVMVGYPNEYTVLGTLASYASLMKWLVLSFAFIGVMILALWFVIGKIKKVG